MLVDAPWGGGKTYFGKNFSSLLKSDYNSFPIYIGAFESEVVSRIFRTFCSSHISSVLASSGGAGADLASGTRSDDPALQGARQPKFYSDTSSFILMYRCVPHFWPAMYRRRAATSIRAACPSGKLPTTRVRRRISRFRRSSGLLVRM